MIHLTRHSLNLFAILLATLIIGTASFLVHAQSGGTWQSCFYFGLFGVTIGPPECGGPPPGSECSPGCGGPLGGVCPTDYCWSVWVPDPAPVCATAGQPCGPSAANSCGMTSSGTIDPTTCTCNAVTPSDALCPPPDPPPPGQCPGQWSEGGFNSWGDEGNPYVFQACTCEEAGQYTQPDGSCGASPAPTCADNGQLGTWPDCYDPPPPPPGCTPDPSCAANTCSGSSCTDSCGVPYAGTMDCTPSCTPDPSCAANTCSGSTCSDACGNTYSGTMSCAVTFPNLTQPTISYTPSAGFDLTTGNYNQVSVSFTTSNNGDAAAGSSNYRFQFDSGNNGYETTNSASLGTLNISQNVTRNENVLNVPFGPTSIRILVDSSSAVAESNEGDNERTLTFTLPPPDPGLTISVDRIQVRAGESVTLTWSSVASYPMNCIVFGPGVNISPSPRNGTQLTQGINAKSEFTYSCTEPITGTTFSDSVTVETTGTIEER